VLACCTVLVIAGGILFAHEASADRLDRALDAPIITGLGHHPGLLPWLALPGSLIPAALLSAAVALASLVAGRLNGAVLGVLAVPAAVGLAEGVLKPLVHRTYLGVLTYPSGHTTAVFALAAAVTVLVAGPSAPGRDRVLRILAVAVACLLGVIVAAAVIGLRWHYFTDTVAGAAVGTGTVCGLAFLLDLAPVRRLLALAVRQPPAQQPRSDEVGSPLPGS
jgi:membrane-associated phospholipid phosphatase